MERGDITWEYRLEDILWSSLTCMCIISECRYFLWDKVRKKLRCPAPYSFPRSVCRWVVRLSVLCYVIMATNLHGTRTRLNFPSSAWVFWCNSIAASILSSGLLVLVPSVLRTSWEALRMEYGLPNPPMWLGIPDAPIPIWSVLLTLVLVWGIGVLSSTVAVLLDNARILPIFYICIAVVSFTVGVVYLLSSSMLLRSICRNKHQFPATVVVKIASLCTIAPLVGLGVTLSLLISAFGLMQQDAPKVFDEMFPQYDMHAYDWSRNINIWAHWAVSLTMQMVYPDPPIDVPFSWSQLWCAPRIFPLATQNPMVAHEPDSWADHESEDAFSNDIWGSVRRTWEGVGQSFLPWNSICRLECSV
jgi:hypothetical protein